MAKKINPGYLHEAMDRTSIITNNLEDYVVNNKAVKKIPSVRKKIKEAISLLADAYKDLGAQVLTTKTKK